jgi:sulfur-oxidizing protein SoxA
MRAFAAGLALLAAAAWAQESRRSGFDFMSTATQAMQRDDAQNPAMLWVQDGASRWSHREGSAGKACADCHTEAAMRGVAARYPAFDPTLDRPVTLSQRINACRVRHMQAEPLPVEGEALLGLEAWVALRSRGMPITPPDDARLAPWRERGREQFFRRIGQLDLACTHCHDARAGRRLAGSVIPQAQIGNYPSYRLEWQSLGSLQRRLRGCMTGVRAEPLAPDAPEWVELELYLASRSRGLPLEAPSVRP